MFDSLLGTSHSFSQLFFTLHVQKSIPDRNMHRVVVKLKLKVDW